MKDSFAKYVVSFTIHLIVEFTVFIFHELIEVVGNEENYNNQEGEANAINLY